MQISSADVSTPSVRRVVSMLVVSVVCATSLGHTIGQAQTTTACQDQSEETYETYGPTDITAVTGNRRMTAALNNKATVTVLKWPSPSYFDQIKYRTTDRSEPRMGALPNEGAFIGLGYKKGAGRWRFDWLREWPSRQRFADDDGDEIITRFHNKRQGLTAAVRDLVSHEVDSLSRTVVVRRRATSPITRVRVMSLANFNPVFSKTPRSATDDWCTEEDNDNGATYNSKIDAIVHERSGTDASTGEPSGVALTMGFAGASDGHHIGVDTYGTGSGEGSAYDDALDGRLSGSNSGIGQVDAAMSDDILLAKKRAGTSTIYISAGPSVADSVATLRTMRKRSVGSVRAAKGRWWASWLEGSRLPKDAPAAVLRLAKRSLISARQAADPGGLIVASVSTQPPHGLDWIRNGAYINRMLDLAGFHDMVSRHNLRYSALQATTVSKPPGGEATPPGNWAQNYYADGVVGGPIPYEIDATGLGIWTLWDHYTFTKDRSYLLAVYEAIQRAAHYLSDNPPLGCRDPATGLHCAANEGDNTETSRTLVGAQAVWLGLDAAVRAALELGTETAKENAVKWAQRRDELADAIRTNYLDEGCGCYTRDHEVGGTILWPVGLEPYGSKISDAQAEVNWRHMAGAISGKLDRGKMSAKVLLGNAFAWQEQPRKMRGIERGLRWMAGVATTGTGLLGEAWMRLGAEKPTTRTMVAQPNVWHQAIFYLAALKTYGTERWTP